MDCTVCITPKIFLGEIPTNPLPADEESSLAKITIPTITGSFASVTQLNNSFQQLEDELNNKVLYRNNLVGEPNSLSNDIDLNSNDILNANNIFASTITVSGTDITASVIAATTSASEAAADAAIASTKANEAANSAAQAGILLDEFDDLYLGSKASDPALDNDGDPLQVGALYFNSVSNDLRAYTGSVWVPATAASANVSYTPSGFLTATNVQGALDEVGAISAGSVANTPAGNITSTDVQAALNEIQSDVDTRAKSVDTVVKFDTVALLVAATNLSIGDIAETAGYLTKGDGGDNRYEIVAAATGTVDGGVFINLATHQAKGLFPTGSVDVRQFGAVGDGTTDDTVALQAALDSGLSEVVYGSGVFITDSLTITSPIVVNGQKKGGTIKFKNTASGNALLTVTSNKVSIIDGDFDGNRLNNTGKNIIEKASGDDFICIGNRVHDGSNIGIVIKVGNRIRVEDNEVFDCTFQQILTNGVDGDINTISISRNKVYLSAIGINTDNGGIGNNAGTNSISGLSVQDNNINLIVDASAPVNHVGITTFANVNQYRISNNTVTGGRIGISNAGAHNGICTNNVVFQPFQIGIEVATGGAFQSSNIVVSGNQINGSDSGGTTNTKGIAVTSTASGSSVTNVLVSDNSIINSFLPIQAAEASPGFVDDVSIIGNKVKFSSVNSRIDIGFVSRLSVKDNHIDMNDKTGAIGIKLSDCDVLDVSNNLMFKSAAGTSGVLVVGSSVPLSFASIKNNQLQGSGSGVVLSGYIRFSGDTGVNITGSVEISSNVGLAITTRNSNDGNPSVALADYIFLTGSSTVTNLIHGYVGKEIQIRAAGAPTIQDNASLVLAGGVNFVMASGDTITLRQFSAGVWTETSRSVN